MRRVVYRSIAGLVILLAIVLSGCATGYQPYSITGGYKNQQVGPNRYYVEFYGNGNTNRDTVFAYWLYRCAELTQEKGFDYFIIVSDAPPPGISGGSATIQVASYTITTWSGRGVIELYKGVPSEYLDRVGIAKDIIAALGPAVREAMASHGNVKLPPGYSPDPPRRSGPLKLDDLEALLPK